MVETEKLLTDEESLLAEFGDKRLTGKLETAVFFALTWTLQINLIFCLTYEWSDFLNRILAMKEILMTCFATSGYFIQNDMLILEKKLIERYLKNIQYHNTSAERDRIIMETNKFIKWFNVVSIRAFKFMFIFGGCLPMLQVCIVLTKSYFTGAKLEKVPFVVYGYIPERFRTIPGHLTAQLLCFTWYLMVSYMWGLTYKVYLISLKCVETEMDLLCLSMQEIGAMSGSGNDSILVYKSDTEKVQGNEEDKLRVFLSSIIQLHQHILSFYNISGALLLKKVGTLTCTRIQTAEDTPLVAIGIFAIPYADLFLLSALSMTLMSKHLKLVIVTFINIYGLQTCMYMIFLMKMKETGIRMKYAFIYMVVMYIMFTCTKSGQVIKNKGDEVRLAFYECAWVNKPQWMKRSLLVMMTKAIEPVELKPYGLYVLDMNCMANILKATYTYFNIANEFLK